MAEIVLHKCSKCGMTSQWPPGTAKPRCPNCSTPGGVLPGVDRQVKAGDRGAASDKRKTGR